MLLKYNQLVNQYADINVFIFNKNTNNTLKLVQYGRYFSDDFSGIFSAMKIVISFPPETLVSDLIQNKSAITSDIGLAQNICKPWITGSKDVPGFYHKCASSGIKELIWNFIKPVTNNKLHIREHIGN